LPQIHADERGLFLFDPARADDSTRDLDNAGIGTSAAKAGFPAAPDRRPKGLLHPVSTTSIFRSEKHKSLLHPVIGSAFSANRQFSVVPDGT
jgi:hypothetical protein